MKKKTVKKEVKPVEPKKAWEQPFDWQPKEACWACDGDGMGPRKEFYGDSIIDWDDCPKCEETGEQKSKE